MSLDQDQQRVANWGEGSVFVSAGAGSGKTTTITSRTVRLIKNRLARPEEVLLLTFSRKAAGEMRDRVAADLGGDIASRIPIDTYHAFGAKLIRENPSVHGRQSNPVLLDESDARKAFRAAMKEASICLDAEHLSAVRDAYSRLRDDLKPILAENLAKELPDTVDVDDALVIIHHYESAKRAQNQLDYDDLICLPAAALSESLTWRKTVTDRYAFLIVDEAQDTCFAQYKLICGLAPEDNVMMVGDDDQTIYGWRGARFENIGNFIEEFGATVLPLSRNYRSTSEIVDAASRHIRLNSNRIEKNPYSAIGSSDEPVRLIRSDNARESAGKIAKRMRSALDKGIQMENFAILYRTNRLAGFLEQSLIEQGVPYKLVGGPRMAERHEIRLAMAAATLAVPGIRSTAEIARWADYLPKVGEKTIRELFQTAYAARAGLFDAIEATPMSHAAKASLMDFRDRVRSLSEMGVCALDDWLLGASGMDLASRWAVAGKMNAHEIEERSQNIARFADWIRVKFEALPEEEQLDPYRQWFLPMELILSDEEAQTAAEGKGLLTLSTIHRAKGLEWNEVHLFGYSTGFMPLSKTSEEDAPPQALEEERRLSYVALTRARRRVFIHHADVYDFGYDRQGATISPFAEEIMGYAVEQKPKPKTMATKPTFKV
ncbi:ATP-dependent helicase [Vogesella sp. XCS3]|uniref:ATP-dependent helicase n=1 Tax=Vogesella sp. XCS3 TaxID=2877939 RepID=UPI001D0AB2A6|nr:ATP-dependent helicase [Vogesella sp. XCS3]UDM18908.1 ATP-dependent helicase [Vogesella sp. XCS3]